MGTEFAVKYALLICFQTVFGKYAPESFKSVSCLGILHRSRNIIQYPCTVMLYDMADHFLHCPAVVYAYIVELRLVIAVEYHRRYPCLFYSFCNALSDALIVYRIGKKYSTVKNIEIRHIIDTVFSRIKALAVQHTAKCREIGYIYIIFFYKAVYSSNYIILIFLVKSCCYNCNMRNPVFFHCHLSFLMDLNCFTYKNIHYDL